MAHRLLTASIQRHLVPSCRIAPCMKCMASAVRPFPVCLSVCHPCVLCHSPISHFRAGAAIPVLLHRHCRVTPTFKLWPAVFLPLHLRVRVRALLAAPPGLTGPQACLQIFRLPTFCDRIGSSAVWVELLHHMWCNQRLSVIDVVRCRVGAQVVEEVLEVADLRNKDVLHFAGDSVQQVKKRNKGVYIGDARVVTEDLRAGNAVVHIVDNMLGNNESQPAQEQNSDFSKADGSAVQAASKLLDAEFLDSSKHEEIAEGIANMNIPGFQKNRDLVAHPDGGLYNPMALIFDPSFNTQDFSKPIEHFTYPFLDDVKRPESEDDLAFMTVLQLGSLIRSRQITSVELAKIYIERLKKRDHVLKAVVTYTEELAQEQAAAADKLLSEGTYVGPLHGIPYGLKDIFAVPGYKTTWGSCSYKDQVIEKEAWVYQKLKNAGAVLIAKLASGSLAYDDIWFGGQTKNPWNIMEGSTGSSAGPASSTSAGNVPFAIGSETSGSITMPAARVGVTALRPTFGMVGRTWSMSLSESLDKIGPFCRSAADCAVILDIIRGKDPNDWSSKNIHLEDPFSIDVTKLTIGYLPDADMEVVKVLEKQGVKMVPFELKYSISTAQFTLKITMEVDVLAHFDHWQREGLDEDYEDQSAWPVVVRRARLISAVDYLQAQRVRGKLAQELRDIMEKHKIDAFVGNATDWEWICAGNLVGMPVMVIPTGLKDVEDPPANGTRRRTTITTGIYAPPFQDAKVLALAMAYQSVTDHHLQRPPVDNLSPDDPAHP